MESVLAAALAADNIESAVRVFESVFGRILERRESLYYGGAYYIGWFYGNEVVLRSNWELDELADERIPAEAFLVEFTVNEGADYDSKCVAGMLIEAGCQLLD